LTALVPDERNGENGMNVTELDGALLDYWVARIEGGNPTLEDRGFGSANMTCIAQIMNFERVPYRPSLDWLVGGPIIERELKALQEGGGDGIWRAPEAYKCQFTKNGYVGEGPTILIAAMRAYVASKYGAELKEGLALISRPIRER
jgi:hypothetical protein